MAISSECRDVYDSVIVVIAALVMCVPNFRMLMVMIGRNGPGNGGDGHHSAQPKAVGQMTVTDQPIDG